MTGRAVVHDTGMIEHRSDEAGGVMTGTAILVCYHVSGCFACRKNIVMAGCTVIHDACMTERGRHKARGYMTHTAILVGRHMVGRRRLAGGGDAVMTV
jgi:hypothetical protein